MFWNKVSSVIKLHSAEKPERYFVFKRLSNIKVFETTLENTHFLKKSQYRKITLKSFLIGITRVANCSNFCRSLGCGMKLDWKTEFKKKRRKAIIAFHFLKRQLKTRYIKKAGLSIAENAPQFFGKPIW